MKKHKKQTKFSTILIISVVLTLGLTISLQSLLASWKAPDTEAPISNLSPVLTLDGVNQNINGSLFIHQNLAVAGGALYIDYANSAVGLNHTNPTSKLDIEGVLRNRSVVDNNDYIEMEYNASNEAVVTLDAGGQSFKILMNSTSTIEVDNNGDMYIDGGIRLGSTTACDASVAGMLIYDEKENQLRACDGSTYVPFVSLECDDEHIDNCTQAECEAMGAHYCGEINGYTGKCQYLQCTGWRFATFDSTVGDCNEVCAEFNGDFFKPHPVSAINYPICNGYTTSFGDPITWLGTAGVCSTTPSCGGYNIADGLCEVCIGDTPSAVCNTVPVETCACNKPMAKDQGSAIYANVVEEDDPMWVTTTVICTELYRQGHIPDEWLEADLAYSKKYIDEATMLGYHVWGKPMVRVMRKNQRINELIVPLAKEWSRNMAYKMGLVEENSKVGELLLDMGLPFCKDIGEYMLTNDYSDIEVDDAVVEKLALKYIKKYDYEDLQNEASRDEIKRDMGLFLDEIKTEFYKDLNKR